jgi:hypothetical protein
VRASEANIGHNGQGPLNIDAAHLMSVVDQLLALELRHDRLAAEQKASMREIGDLLWQDGWRGRDGRRLPNPMERF